MPSERARRIKCGAWRSCCSCSVPWNSWLRQSTSEFDSLCFGTYPKQAHSASCNRGGRGKGFNSKANIEQNAQCRGSVSSSNNNDNIDNRSTKQRTAGSGASRRAAKQRGSGQRAAAAAVAAAAAAAAATTTTTTTTTTQDRAKLQFARRSVEKARAQKA